MNDFARLLSSKTGNITRYGNPQYVIHELMVNRQRMTNGWSTLSMKYYKTMFDYDVIKYCIIYNMYDMYNK